MLLSREQVISRLRRYVDAPSGSNDLEGLAAFSALVEEDMRALGFDVIRHRGIHTGDTLECRIGSGRRTLLLLGHMDTVFPRDQSRRLSVVGEDLVEGSGVMDMKGGLLIMQEALRAFLPRLPEDGCVVCVLNGDEETGAGFSEPIIRRCAEKAFACLCFEPMRESGALVRSRKGVLSFTIRCRGISGHAGAASGTSASAIEQLCRIAGEVYALRDHERGISVNIGVISGGTATNVVCDEAELKGEIRCCRREEAQMLRNSLEALCAAPGIPGTKTELIIRSSHPPFESDEKSLRLLELAQRIGGTMEMNISAEDTGGAGDVAFAAAQGAACLDGLGLHGTHMHTLQETGTISSFAQNVALSLKLMVALFQEN